MKVLVLIARLLLGLVFLVFGLNGFLHFIPSPPMEGTMAAFIGAIVSSHYGYLIFGVQVIAGVLLLSGQFVPLAIAMLAPMLANIITFHLTMETAGLDPRPFRHCCGLYSPGHIAVISLRYSREAQSRTLELSSVGGRH